MKTIGLIGGMSWESTVHYYRRINEGIKNRLGGLHSARIILYSVDFDDIERMQNSGDWDAAGNYLAEAACRLESSGADFLVLCTNTMHKVAPAIERQARIPLLHIADATAESIKKSGISRVGLLGTRFTMEEEFYRGRLATQHSLEVMVPEAFELESVHGIIYNELCLGLIRDQSRMVFRRIISNLISRGAEGIILGCTEIGMLLSAKDASVPVFDTTDIHAAGAVDFALS